MPLTEQDFEVLRNARNNFLSSTDKYMWIPDLPEDIKTEILEYRQVMRDITDKFGTEWTEPEHVNWPEYPSKIRESVATPPTE